MEPQPQPERKPANAVLDEVSVVEMLGKVEQVMRYGLERSHLTLEIDCPPEIGTIHTKRSSLEQVLIELLGNATKFASPGRVRLIVRPAITLNLPGPAISFTVIDDGPGFSLSQYPGLMREFPIPELRALYRNGIGLFMVAKQCEQLGGDLVVATAPQKGVEVTLTLPVSRESTESSTLQTG